VGIEVQEPDNFELIKERLKENKITYRLLSPDDEIFKMLL